MFLIPPEAYLCAGVGARAYSQFSPDLQTYINMSISSPDTDTGVPIRRRAAPWDLNVHKLIFQTRTPRAPRLARGHYPTSPERYFIPDAAPWPYVVVSKVRMITIE